MSKFACRCGEIMILTVDWSDYELSLVPQENIVNIANILEEKNNMHPDVFFDELGKGKVNVLRCPVCGRLWLQNKDYTFSSYIKEDP